MSATTSEFSQFSDDMNEVAKLRGFSSSEQQLVDNIWNQAISWITTHDCHLCYPNSIQWSNQNVICCIHGPFITLIDMKLLYHSRPLDSVPHECRSDLLSGLKGAFSQIQCIPHINNQNNIIINQPLSLDCIPSISNPVFINVRWCPYPPSFFTQFGLLAAIQSNHIINIYGIPSFTFYHCSNSVIPAQWTSMIDLTKYLQPFQLKTDQRIQFYGNNKIILHSTCMTWLHHHNNNKNKNNIQHLIIGTREGFCVLFKLSFEYHPSLHNTKSNTNNNNNKNKNKNKNNKNNRRGGFDIDILNAFHCFDGVNKKNCERKKRRKKETLNYNRVVITQIESIEFKDEIFVAIALENGLCQIWKNNEDSFAIFEIIKQIDFENKGSIACLNWYKSLNNENNFYLAICAQRLIHILEIRIPHKRPSFKQYSSSNWMNNKTLPYYPKMGIVGMQFINLANKTITITSSYDGSIHAWNVPDCSPIINNNDTDNDNDIYDKLIIDICRKLCDKLQEEIKDIAKLSNLSCKQVTSFGIAQDPNGLLLGLLHPVPKESKTRKAQGLQTLHVYPISVDYKTVYDIIFQNGQTYNKYNKYLHPTSIAIVLDYFIPLHHHIVNQFIKYHEKTFAPWFQIQEDDDDVLQLDIDKILKSEDSLRYCLMMIRYFVSRIQPFDGMQNNSQLKWLDSRIWTILEVLIQLHCYKTLRQFINISNEKYKHKHNDDDDIDMKHDDDDDEYDDEYDEDVEEMNEDKYLSIYLMFVWTLFTYLNNKNKKHLTVIFSYLSKELLIKLEKVFKIINDSNCYEKCHQVRKCLYGTDDSDNDEDDDNEHDSFTMNFEKVEHCPICSKLTSVVMHSGPCGSDGDHDRHMVSRCCVSFKIISDYNQLYCGCCNGSITQQITQKLMMNTHDIMIQSFNHCKPFICSICNVPLVQVL